MLYRILLLIWVLIPPTDTRRKSRPCLLVDGWNQPTYSGPSVALGPVCSSTRGNNLPTPGRRLPQGLCARRWGGTTYILRAVGCPRPCVLVDGVEPINQPGTIGCHRACVLVDEVKPTYQPGTVGCHRAGLLVDGVEQPTYSGPSVATGPVARRRGGEHPTRPGECKG